MSNTEGAILQILFNGFIFYVLYEFHNMQECWPQISPAEALGLLITYPIIYTLPMLKHLHSTYKNSAENYWNKMFWHN